MLGLLSSIIMAHQKQGPKNKDYVTSWTKNRKKIIAYIKEQLNHSRVGPYTVTSLLGELQVLRSPHLSTPNHGN